MSKDTDNLDDIFNDLDASVAKPDHLLDNGTSKQDTKVKAKVAKAAKTGRKSGAATGEPKLTKRVPMHIRQPIRSDDRPGYRRRVVKNDPMRIERLKMAGYSIVEDGTEIGDPVAGQATSPGGMSAKIINASSGGWGVLMEIPEEYYQEDLKAKHDKIDRDEETRIVAEAEKVGGGVGEHVGQINL